ncbi:MAG: hypothetical protein MZV49_14170 [Rhodopseudomonas palustris]|nr:hypothetical protein [Rhodopseudomonas palustris]
MIEALERALPDFFYTVVPVVHGPGAQKRRLGTATWPEENFLLLAYVRDEDRAAKLGDVGGVRQAGSTPQEGIKVFSVSADE